MIKKYKLLFMLFILSILNMSVLASDEKDCGFGQIQSMNPDSVYSRPIIENEQLIETEHFLIHFTLDDPSPERNDATTIEYATEVAQYAENVYNYFQLLNFQMPPVDQPFGNEQEKKYDIYIYNLIAAHGYNGATNWEAHAFWNPDYQNSYTSFIEIRNTYFAPEDYPSEMTPNERLELLILHEFFHAVEYGYSNFIHLANYNYWPYENFSVYFEQKYFPDKNFLYFRINNPEIRPGDLDPLGWPEYGIDTYANFYNYPGGLFPYFLDLFYQDADIIRKLMNEYGKQFNSKFIETIDEVIKANYQDNLQNLLNYYGIWRYFTGTRNREDMFPNSIELKTAPKYANLILTEQDYQEVVSGKGKTEGIDGPGGVRYISINNSEQRSYSLNIELSGSQNASWGGAIVKLYANGNIEVESFNPINDSLLHYHSNISYKCNEIVVIPIVYSDSTYRSVATASNSFKLTFATSPLFEIYFANRVGNREDLGTIIVDDSLIIPSGTDYFFQENGSHEARTSNERFELDSIFKHLNWNSFGFDHFLNHSFSTEYLSEIAKFEPLSPAIIENYSISANAVIPGPVDFKDPWYVDATGNQPDAFYTATSPHLPTGNANEQNGGVFLNQRYYIPDEIYYSIRARDPIQIMHHDEAIDYYFDIWEGTGVEFEHADSLQTAVIFKQPNAVARAVYKGHMATDLSNNSWKNALRRVVKDGYGTFHLVYEDDGNIYYTTSTDAKVWSREEPVIKKDDSGMFFTSPTLCVADNNLYLVYLEYYPENICSFIIRSKPLPGGSWTSEQYIEPATGFTGYNGYIPYGTLTYVDNQLQPSDYLVFVYAKNNSNNSFSLHTLYQVPGNPTWQTGETINGAKNPALATSNNQLYPILTYQYGDAIYAQKWSKGSPGQWDFPVNLSSSAVWTVGHKNPQVDVVNNTAFVTWQADYEIGAEHVILSRKLDITDMSRLGLTEVEVSLSSLQNPTVSVISDSRYMILYQKDNKVKKRDMINSGLVSEQTYLDGRYPSSVPRSNMGVFAGYNAPPYLLKSSEEFSQQQTFAKEGSADSTVLVESKRFTYVQDSDYLSFYFQHFTLGDQSLYLDSALYSNPVTITSSGEKLYANLSYLVGGEVSFDNPDQVLFAVNFDDGTTTYRLQSFTVADIRTIMSNDSLGEGISEISISGMSGKSGRLFITFPHVQPLVSGVIVESNDVQLAKGSVPSEPTSHQVTEFSLGVNYPNPFNPTTTIPFALPEDGHVQLIIYNTAGQKVRTLINAPLKRGTHSALWDGLTDNGSQVASGIYLYRFIYRDVDGKQIVKSRKMLLLK